MIIDLFANSFCFGALVLPFFLARRWDGFGFMLSVVGIWVPIFASTWIGREYGEPRINAAFMGVWICIGPPFAIIWTAAVAGIGFLFEVARSRLRKWREARAA